MEYKFKKKMLVPQMWTANHQPLQVFFGFQSKKTPAQDAKLLNSIHPFRTQDRGVAIHRYAQLKLL